MFLMTLRDPKRDEGKGKLLIYKLYDKADCAKTARHARALKGEFQATRLTGGLRGEQRRTARRRPRAGRTAFRVLVTGTPGAGGATRVHSGSAAGNRPRSASCVVSLGATQPQSPAVSRTAYPKSPAVHDCPEVRGLKHRCITRRCSPGVDTGFVHVILEGSRFLDFEYREEILSAFLITKVEIIQNSVSKS